MGRLEKNIIKSVVNIILDGAENCGENKTGQISYSVSGTRFSGELRNNPSIPLRLMDTSLKAKEGLQEREVTVQWPEGGWW